MCRFRSGIAVRRGEDIELFALDNDDSHAAIQDVCNIPDDNGGLAGRYWTPVEFVPRGHLTDFDDYTLAYNAGRPEWITDTMEAAIVRKFRHILDAEVTTNVIARRDELNLSFVKTLPANCQLSAGGYLDLSALRAMAEGCNLSAGGYLYLSSLTALPKNCTLSAGGSLDLHLLKTLPEGCTLSAGGDIYLGSLTEIAKNCQISAGGYLNLHSLTALPDGCQVHARHIVWLTKNS